MTTLAPGASITVTVPQGGEVSVSTNGGLAQVAVTAAAGIQRTAQLGPAPARRAFGPYPLGAQLTLTNTSCNSFIYDSPGDAPGVIATRPGQPSKPVLTAMAGAVSVAWASGAAGSSPTTINIWTDIYGNVTPLNTNPQTITAIAGTPYTGTVTTVNGQGASPTSVQADPVTPISTGAQLRQVSTRTLINQGFSATNSARGRVGSRTNPVDVSQLVLEYDNWWVDGFGQGATYTEIDGTGTVTGFGWVEYPIGTFTIATIDGSLGGGPGVAAPGATLRTICNISIPAGAAYRTEIHLQSTTNCIPFAGRGAFAGGFPATATPTFQATLNDITDLGTNLAIVGGTGTGYAGSHNGDAVGWNRIMAVHSAPAIMNLGTSIDHGEAGLQQATGNAGVEGSAARSLVAANLAYTNYGVRGDSVQKFLASNSKRVALQRYYTHILFGGPTNDVPLTMIAPDASTIMGYMQQQYTLFPSKKKFQCTVLPRAANDGSNGTGVTRAGNPIRVALNNLIKANTAGLNGVFDLCPPVESAPDSGLWKAGPLTTDGTHPLQAGYLAILNANIITAATLGSA